MLRQAEGFRTVNIAGGVGGNGGRGGEQGGSGGVGEGPTANFRGLNADTIHFVFQNNWPGHTPFRPVGVGSSEEARYESSGTSYNSANISNFRGTKRRRDEFEGRSHGSDSSLPTQRVEKRRRLDDDDDEIEQIIPRRNLKLIREIGSGPGYLFHAGENKGHAVVVKVFNRGPRSTNYCKQLESTVALSKGIMHPNLLPLLGISSPESFTHFIVYENVHWQNAEGPLAMALKNDLRRSVTLGFKMVCTINTHLIFSATAHARFQAGLNHLLVQGVFARMMRAENFDIFLDVDDRFVISVHPQSQEEGDVARFQEREGNAWTVFSALCSKTLTSANRILYHEEIHRVPTILDDIPSRPASKNPAVSLSSSGSAASLQNTQEGLDVPPRREYVWRSTDRGQQSLENITRRMTLDLDMEFSSLRRLNQTNGRTPHRCAGYVREEITLATTTLDSAVVAHDAPSALERCLICHEVVDVLEEFRCECGDLALHNPMRGPSPFEGSSHSSHPDMSSILQLDEDGMFSSSGSPPTPTLSLSPSEPARPLLHEFATRDQHWIGVATYPYPTMHNPMRSLSPFEGSSHSSHPDMSPILQLDEDSMSSSSGSPPTLTLSLSPSEPARPLLHEFAMRDQHWIGVATYSYPTLHNPMRGPSPFEGSSHSSHPDMYPPSYNSLNSLAWTNQNGTSRLIEPTTYSNPTMYNPSVGKVTVCTKSKSEVASKRITRSAKHINAATYQCPLPTCSSTVTTLTLTNTKDVEQLVEL
ncbi:hypothetical protein MSAN_01163000 [Mycena sanguinolenta]|uniref:Protein kinase domain-containing protein n=1 Tax=Mycena sanguinolenta TaxID=230812 RepID=A0A8H6YHL2_9AGAR|nr:hypothetical protein MSAN_01163000 [Mycena sanguinolenta]